MQSENHSPALFNILYLQQWDEASKLIEMRRGLNYVEYSEEEANSCIHIACIGGAPLHIIQQLVQAGQSPVRGNQLGRTPLYLAARHNCSLEVIDFLLSQGADINGKDRFSYTPLQAASFNQGDVQMIGHLLRRGADPDYIDMMKTYRRSASSWAALNKRWTIVRYLDTFPIMLVLASSQDHVRVASNSLLKLLPKELLRLVRDYLVLENEPLRE